MVGIFRRPQSAHRATVLALADAGFHLPESGDDEHLSELAGKGNKKLFGKSYIEGDDHQIYFVSKEDSVNFAEGEQVEFEYVPQPQGKKCWARNLRKVNKQGRG